MELDGYKSAWQKRPVEENSLPSPARVSRSLQFLRASAIRDLQRSDELSRLVSCLLFSLVAVGASVLVIPPGAARIAAWIFAAALLLDGLAEMILLVRRHRQPATDTMLEFISREHRNVETRLRLERYSQRIMILLAVVALLLLFVAPRPVNGRESSLEVLERMAIVTAFLAVAWRRAKSRSTETRRELERYLRDLET
jgi:hypothetical protein